MSHARRISHPLQHADPSMHARRIADAVGKAWRQSYTSSQLEVPLGVVAALSLLGVADPDGSDLTDQILKLPAAEFRLRSTWRAPHARGGA
jgi:hypothetical protein